MVLTEKVEQLSGRRAGQPSFRSVLGRVSKVVQSALANADVPFQQVVSNAGIPRSTAYSPLFQTLITVDEENADPLAEVAAAGEEEAMEVWQGCPYFAKSMEKTMKTSLEGVAKSARTFGMRGLCVGYH